MDVQHIIIVGRSPSETGLTGVVHTDSEYNDYIVIISECHGQECSESNFYSYRIRKLCWGGEAVGFCLQGISDNSDESFWLAGVAVRPCYTTLLAPVRGEV